ncbi:galectin-12 isoform X2 [Myotis daubentonii]|nr:galectin-12 isoform X2 [Myotis daubentonii]XP_059567223.1 galectin-12 isoform X2 [Myotis daubentonii]
MVVLQGAVPLEARRFQVDFQCGCSLHPPPDIAIHFNPRFHTTQPHAICNTLQAGRWQAEARWPRLALRRGASFRILFLFGHEDMKVSVNGRHFLHYRYRLPLSRVDTLGIFGDILVKAVGFLNINPFPEGGSEYPVGHSLPFTERTPPDLRVPLLSLTALSAGEPQAGGALLTPPSPGSLAGTGHRAAGAGLAGAQGLHAEPGGRGRACARGSQGLLRGQDAGVGVALGAEAADLGPFPLLPPAVLRGAAAVPGGRAEAGAQRAGPGRHQPGPAGPGAAAGAAGQRHRPALLCAPLRRARDEEGPPRRPRALPPLEVPTCRRHARPSSLPGFAGAGPPAEGRQRGGRASPGLGLPPPGAGGLPPPSFRAWRGGRLCSRTKGQSPGSGM